MQGKQRLLVINRRDMVNETPPARRDRWLRSQGRDPLLVRCPGRHGVKGQLQEAAVRAWPAAQCPPGRSRHAAAAVRALMLGPNVGKFGPDQRLVRQKVVTAPAGRVTRTLALGQGRPGHRSVDARRAAATAG